ncbi:MAG: hypothetical protein R3B82_27625 [Sandaracinaceae bacterium]
MEPLIILVGVAAVPIAAVTYVWLRRRPPWRDLPGEMRKTRPRPVAELREGEVARVVGVVACAEPVPAPLTGRPGDGGRNLHYDGRVWTPEPTPTSSTIRALEGLRPRTSSRSATMRDGPAP